MIRQDIRDNLISKFLNNSTEHKEFTEAMAKYHDYVKEYYISRIPEDILECYKKYPSAVDTIVTLHMQSTIDIKVEPPYYSILDVPLGKPYPYVKIVAEEKDKEEMKALAKDLVVKCNNYSKLREVITDLLSVPILTTEVLKSKIPNIF